MDGRESNATVRPTLGGEQSADGALAGLAACRDCVLGCGWHLLSDPSHGPVRAPHGEAPFPGSPAPLAPSGSTARAASSCATIGRGQACRLTAGPAAEGGGHRGAGGRAGGRRDLLRVGFEIEDARSGPVTFSITVWRLYGGAKGLVMWYYEIEDARSGPRAGGGQARSAFSIVNLLSLVWVLECNVWARAARNGSFW